MGIARGRRNAMLGAGLAGAALAAPPLRAEQPLRVGLLLAMSGPLARTSQEIAYGVALALDQADRRVAGRPIRIHVEDTQGKRSRAVERFVRLVQVDGVDAVIGPTGSPEALALRDAAHDMGVPLIVPNAGASALSAERCSPFVLRVSYSNEQLCAPLGAWMAQGGQGRTAYLLAADNVSGRDHVAAFRKAFAAGGGVVAGEELVPAGTADLAPYLGRLKIQRTDIIFASFFGEAAERFLDAVDAFGLRSSRICGPGWLASTLDLPRIGARAAGIVGATCYLPELDSPRNRAFVAAYTARHANPPGGFAAQGHDAARLLMAGVEALGGNVSNRRALAAMLGRTPFTGARGELVLDPRTNNVVQDILVFETRKRPGGEGIDFEVLARVPSVRVDPDACQMG